MLARSSRLSWFKIIAHNEVGTIVTAGGNRNGFYDMGSQQFFNGFKFYKEDKKSGSWYIFFGIGCFAFALLMVLKVR